METDLLKRLAWHGAITDVARLLSVPVTTVHAWKTRGRVPSWRISALAAAIEQLELDRAKKLRPE
ncbi:MAG: hypothetical protein SNJ79_11655 [Sphingomonadaceae bacterium]